MNRENMDKLTQVIFGRQQTADSIPASETYFALDSMMAQLIQLPDMVLGMYAWSREPLKRKLCFEQKEQHIIQASSCGKTEAALLIKKYGSRDPELLARFMGLKVMTPDFPIDGFRMVFAQYEEPDKVMIFMDAVDRAEELIEKYFLRELLEGVNIRSILLAHEIFHAIEYHKADTIYTRTQKVERWKKPFSNKSEVACLREIAGMAFAKELLGICFSPFILDVLLMYGYHETAAAALYEEIMEIAANSFSFRTDCDMIKTARK